MTLQQLRAFLAVVERGGFRAAARDLQVSQAGLTRKIRDLETSLGQTLMIRSARGVSLTAAGQSLNLRAQLIDFEARQALEGMPLQAGQDATLHVGVGPTPTALLLPKVVPDFHARFPNVKLRLTSGLYERLLPALQHGMLDIALMAVPDSIDWPDLRCTLLFRSAMTVAGRGGHPLSGAQSLSELADAEWILMGSPGGPGGTVTRFFADNGLPAPRVAAVCETFTEITALLGSTDWLALLPAALVRAKLIGPNVRPIRIREQAHQFANCLVQRKNAVPTAHAAAFASMCQSWARVVAR